MAEFFILRHGETVWNVEGRMQGHLDSALTARGREQAVRQGAILRAAGAQGLPVQSSPSGRATETAALALPGSVCTLDDRLCEVAMGAWQGRTMREIERAWPGATDDPHPFLWKFAAPGGETLEAMQTRLAGWLAEQTASCIVVTHGVTSQLLRGALLGCDTAAMAELEDRQGVVYRVRNGMEERLVMDD
ncbi:histidine phosphatase family protein [Tropicimonas marinistellae]|uniref:histidine phosphatase family protein n=1 Tax=Tropicimonas marinistellae TaxID=1739787 RepID=UPI000836EA95|nr:histidine phosphatase family protein [Tropicimonas marinistellae]